MSIVKLARPEIQALRAYQAAAQVDDTIRLNANESPHASPVGNFRRPLNRYPEVRPRWLREALAARFGCAPEQLLVTRGSSEAIDLIVRTFCRAGVDNVVIPTPSFSMYAHYAEIQGAQHIDVSAGPDRDFEIDVDALLAACTPNTRIVFVCSPNNPTGSSLSQSDLGRLIAARKNESVVVVDEAYIEFGNRSSMIACMENHPNLLVLRTLSKALGFAGARCGAVAGASQIIDLLNAVQAPYALATPVIECIEDVLRTEQLAEADNTIRETIAERERIMTAIANYEFVQKVWPSDANFFLVRVDDANRLMARCAEFGVLLRQFGGDLSDCVRITVGGHTDNNRLLQAFDTLQAE